MHGQNHIKSVPVSSVGSFFSYDKNIVTLRQTKHWSVQCTQQFSLYILTAA